MKEKIKKFLRSNFYFLIILEGFVASYMPKWFYEQYACPPVICAAAGLIFAFFVIYAFWEVFHRG